MKKVIGIYYCIKIITTLLFALSGRTCTAAKPHKAEITELIYRSAVPEDLDAIMALHKSFDKEANNNLLTFPGDFHRTQLASKIEARKIHVACDTSSGNIVSFLTFFIIKTAKEQVDILTNELRCIGKEAEPVMEYTGNIIFDPESEPPFTSDYEKEIEHTHDDSKVVTYCYYGGAYTIPEYRSNRINSRLLKATMVEYLAPYIAKQENPIALCFGQVAANINNTLPIRIFLETIHSLTTDDEVTLSRRSCIAYKPTFALGEDGLILLEDDEANQGLGTVLLYTPPTT